MSLVKQNFVHICFNIGAWGNSNFYNMSTASSLFLAAINILQSKTESSKYYKCSRAFDVLKKYCYSNYEQN